MWIATRLSHSKAAKNLGATQEWNAGCSLLVMFPSLKMMCLRAYFAVINLRKFEENRFETCCPNFSKEFVAYFETGTFSKLNMHKSKVVACTI